MKTSKLVLVTLLVAVVGLPGCREGEELLKLRKQVEDLTVQLEKVSAELESTRRELGGCQVARQFEVLQMPTDTGTTIGYSGADDTLHVSSQHGQYMLGNKAFRDRTVEFARTGLWEAHPSALTPADNDWVFRVYDTASNMQGSVIRDVVGATCNGDILQLTIKGAPDPTTLAVGEHRCSAIQQDIASFTDDASIKAILDQSSPEANLVVMPIDGQAVVRFGVRFNKWSVNGKFHECPKAKSTTCPLICQ